MEIELVTCCASMSDYLEEGIVQLDIGHKREGNMVKINASVALKTHQGVDGDLWTGITHCPWCGSKEIFQYFGETE